MADATAHQVATVFLHLAREDEEELTNWKLQQLLYFAQGWYLALHDRPLFDDAIEGWVRGPVVPAVFETYQRHEWRPIPDVPDIAGIPEAVIDHATDVWTGYGEYSEISLDGVTQRELPWQTARRGLEFFESGYERLTAADLTTCFKAQLANNRRRNADAEAAAKARRGRTRKAGRRAAAG